MPVVCLLMLIGIWLLPVSVQAQAWADAVRAADYQRAAGLLYPIVVESFVRSPADEDPAPSRQLAVLYAQGLGVERDPIAACALAQTSDMAAQMSAPRYAADIRRYEALIAESEQFVGDICDGLSYEDRVTASRSIGCFAFGLPAQILMVGRHSVRIDREGIRLAGADAGAVVELQGCPLAIAHITTRTIGPPDNPAPGIGPRHFVELFSWHLSQDPKSQALTYVLQWQPYEVSDAGIGFGGIAEVATVTSWPGLGLPAGLATVPVMEMIRSGHVRWRIDGNPPRRGWFMRSEALTR
jgi:hypothetical protein